MSEGRSPLWDSDLTWSVSSRLNRIRVPTWVTVRRTVLIQMLVCAGFKPNMYRLMQTTGKTLEMAINFTKLFHAKRNRQQFLSFLLRLELVWCRYLSEHQFKSIQFMYLRFNTISVPLSFCCSLSWLTSFNHDRWVILLVVFLCWEITFFLLLMNFFSHLQVF